MRHSDDLWPGPLKVTGAAERRVLNVKLPPDVTGVYRVAQEALHNSVKYSGSTRADVRVAVHNGTLRMSIKDYGAGFDPNVAAGGLGLATMRERLRLLEGELLVNSKPGGGTEIMAQARLDPLSVVAASAGEDCRSAKGTMDEGEEGSEIEREMRYKHRA
jgi:signal transduction histidine kinase